MWAYVFVKVRGRITWVVRVQITTDISVVLEGALYRKDTLNLLVSASGVGDLNPLGLLDIPICLVNEIAVHHVGVGDVCELTQAIRHVQLMNRAST